MFKKTTKRKNKKHIVFFDQLFSWKKRSKSEKFSQEQKFEKKFPGDGSSAAGSIVANQQKVYIYILKKEIFLSKNSWPKKFDFLIVFETKIEFKKKIC